MENRFFTEEVFLQEADYIRLTTNSRRQAMLNRAILAAAKEANDPYYFKYIKAKRRAMKLRKLLRERHYAKGKAKLMGYLANQR